MQASDHLGTLLQSGSLKSLSDTDTIGAKENDILIFREDTRKWTAEPLEGVLPDQTGHEDDVLFSNGTNVEWRSIDYKQDVANMTQALEDNATTYPSNTAVKTATDKLTSDLAAETTAREAAETKLAEDIAAEATTRGENDAVLQSNIDVVSGDLDTAKGELSAEIQKVAGSVEAEATARSEADTTLQTNINTVQTNVDTVQGNLDTEAVDRMDADDLLQQHIDAVLPPQAGNEGKFLGTDGAVAKWEKVDALPAQAGNDGKFLSTNGTVASWEVLKMDEKANTTLDNLTPAGIQVIKDNSELRDQNTGEVRKDWIGTLQEYNDQDIRNTHPDYVCFIKDDFQGGASVYTKEEIAMVSANRDLSNLTQSGSSKIFNRVTPNLKTAIALSSLVSAGDTFTPEYDCYIQLGSNSGGVTAAVIHDVETGKLILRRTFNAVEDAQLQVHSCYVKRGQKIIFDRLTIAPNDRVNCFICNQEEV